MKKSKISLFDRLPIFQVTLLDLYKTYLLNLLFLVCISITSIELNIRNILYHIHLEHFVVYILRLSRPIDARSHDLCSNRGIFKITESHKVRIALSGVYSTAYKQDL